MLEHGHTIADDNDQTARIETIGKWTKVFGKRDSLISTEIVKPIITCNKYQVFHDDDNDSDSDQDQETNTQNNPRRRHDKTHNPNRRQRRTAKLQQAQVQRSDADNYLLQDEATRDVAAGDEYTELDWQALEATETDDSSTEDFIVCECETCVTCNYYNEQPCNYYNNTLHKNHIVTTNNENSMVTTLQHDNHNATGNGSSPSYLDGRLVFKRSFDIHSTASSNCVGGLGHTSGRHARAKHLGWIPSATHFQCQNCRARDFQTQMFGLSVKNEHEFARHAGDQWTQSLGPLVKNEHEFAQQFGGSPNIGTCPSGYIPGDTNTSLASVRETTLTPTDAVRGDKTSVVTTRRGHPPVAGREGTFSRATCTGSIPAEAPPTAPAVRRARALCQPELIRSRSQQCRQATQADSQHPRA